MTIQEAIAQADALKPNDYPTADKIRWLSRLDARIVREIIETHEYNDGEEEVSFSGYGVGDGAAELLAGEPYDEMYIHYLAAQIDYYNREYAAFNATSAMFESVYGGFRNAYNASHAPKTREKTYF